MNLKKSGIYILLRQKSGGFLVVSSSMPVDITAPGAGAVGPTVAGQGFGSNLL